MIAETVFPHTLVLLPYAVIIFGIYLLSKHGEEDIGSGSIGSDTQASRAHLTSGHFGALMPLSPSHRTASMLASQHSKTFEDKSEQTPLRYEHPNGNGSGYHPNGNESSNGNGVVVKSSKQNAEQQKAYQRIVV